MSMKKSILSRRRINSIQNMMAGGNLSTRSLTAENNYTSSSVNDSLDDHHSLFLSTDTGDTIFRRVSFVAVPRRLSHDSGEAAGSLDELWGLHPNLKAPESRNLSAMLDAVDASEDTGSLGHHSALRSNNSGGIHRKSEKSLRFAVDDASLDV